jgi:hypothetical protein
MPPEITREEAVKIIESQFENPMARVVIAFAGKWYDVRGLSDAEFESFTKTLIGDQTVEIRHKDVEL